MKKHIKHNRKAAAAGALLLAIMMTTSACGGNAGPIGDEENPGSSAPVAESGNQLPEESGVIDPAAPVAENDSVASPEPETDTSADEDAAVNVSEPISAEGVYTGQIDSHSIEITINGIAAAYQFPGDMTAAIEALPADSPVTFQYTEKIIEGEDKLKQLWLVKVEAIQ
ncbi:hypothetical protein [Paenibacillus sp. PL2-23]|uniref:hypothetical protein n=1 Tax=Paenibacillus sp. PL2-23 TaxID=2100729 RepID=UPI0030FC59BC